MAHISHRRYVEIALTFYARGVGIFFYHLLPYQILDD